MNMVSRLTKKVANNKYIRKAAEKVSSYPLVLTVEVKRLDGVLAINIPPPLTDTIWYSVCVRGLASTVGVLIMHRSKKLFLPCNVILEIWKNLTHN